VHFPFFFDAGGIVDFVDLLSLLDVCENIITRGACLIFDFGKSLPCYLV